MPPFQSQDGRSVPRVRRTRDFCREAAEAVLLVATDFSPPAVMVGLIQDTKHALGEPLVRRRTWNSDYSTAAGCFGTDLLHTSSPERRGSMTIQ